MDTLRKLAGFGPAASAVEDESLAVEEEAEDLEENGNGSDDVYAAGALLIRAPITDDTEPGDGEASFGSGESFDSALERMAASSTASLEAGSPKGTPVGSYHSPPPLLSSGDDQDKNVSELDLANGKVSSNVGEENEGQEAPAMPVAKLTAEEDDEIRDESAEENVDEVGEDGLEFEEADGEVQEASEDEGEEVYPRVTAEGLPVQGAGEDSLSEPSPTVAVQDSFVAEGEGFSEGFSDVVEARPQSVGDLRLEEPRAAETEQDLAAVEENKAKVEFEEEEVPAVVEGVAEERKELGQAQDLKGDDSLPKIDVDTSVHEVVASESVSLKEPAADLHVSDLSEVSKAGMEELATSRDLEAVLEDHKSSQEPDTGLGGAKLLEGPVAPPAEPDSSDEAMPGQQGEPQSQKPKYEEETDVEVNAIKSLVVELEETLVLKEDLPAQDVLQASQDMSKAVEDNLVREVLEVPKEEPEAPTEETKALNEVLGSLEKRPDAWKEELEAPKEELEAPKEELVVPKEEPQNEELEAPEEEPEALKEGPVEGLQDEPKALSEEPEVSREKPKLGGEEPEAPKDEQEVFREETGVSGELVEAPKDDPEVPKDESKVIVEEPAVPEEEPAVIAEAEAGISEAKPAIPDLKKTSSEDKTVDVEAGGDEFPFESEQSESITVLDSDNEEETEDWDDEIEEDDEDEDDLLIERSAAFAALVHAADSSSNGNREAPSLGAAGPSLPARPAGLGRSVPSLEPAPRASNSQRGASTAVSVQSAGQAEEAQPNGEVNDGHEETREKLEVIRVKFLRLAHRLGQSAHNVVVAQVLYRLGLAEQLRGGRNRSGAFSFDQASAIAEEQEAAGPEELDFTCTIMLLGKTGVGKSATINSIFDEVKSGTNAFSPATKKVQEIIGTVHGIKVRVIDTPGLLPSVSDQRHNEKVMSSVKRFIKKSPPDIVLYFDRLDMQSRDYGDLPLLRTITDTFGPAVWFNAIVVLTHAASAPPDGPNGLPLSYEMFVAQRSHVVQQTIRQAAGDMRLMNPVSLVENHPACRTNRSGQRVLPNGQIWKPHLLLLCFASKILAEANSLLKLQDNSAGRPFGTRQRVPPLPFLLSSLLQSRQQLKLMDEQMGEEEESDEDLEGEDSDDEAEYDQLPPFRRLSKEEILDLDEKQRREYTQELADRERLFQKKQWREELRRRKEMKKRSAALAKEQTAEDIADEENARAAAVPVPLPDMVLPPSFDSDNPTHRYRYLEAPNQWLVRPVLETHGWDHDSGYDGFSVEKGFVIKNKVPAQISGQITKDKKEVNLNMECAASFKHGEGKVTLSGLDIQTIGKDLAYTLRSETRFSNFKQNKTTAGLALTMLGDTIAAGLKLENRLIVSKRLKLVVNGGALTGKGDVAYGGSLEATLRDKDYPFSRTLSTLGLSIMDWHGDLAIGGNLQSQFLLGKMMISGRANLNNRGAGQISIRASSSEQLQMALIGIIPILRSLMSAKFFGSSQAG